MVSQSHFDESESLVAALFAKEIPEIASGVVEIRALARVPGVRTKVAVSSSEPMVNALRACVGPNETHIRRIMAALHEPVDVIPWSDSPERNIRHALAPLEIADVELASETASARVTLAPNGAGDASATSCLLASNITGWAIEIVVDGRAA